MKRIRYIAAALVAALAVFTAGYTAKAELVTYAEQTGNEESNITLAEIPAYTGSAYTVINNNVPYFTESELTTVSFESYSELDALGRCGTAYANIGLDLMPTEERESISSVTPSGWQSVMYDGEYLFNRCHLIGYQLTAENANEKNLITGTRYLNIEGMLPFENMVADFVEETGYHVLYRVTPMFDGNNLVASGVLMEALSVEDGGEGIEYCVYCYNVQPGVTIDYASGASVQDGTTVVSEEVGSSSSSSSQGTTYVLNTNSKKFHYPDCVSAKKISAENYAEYTGTREDLIAQGYDPCKNCNP